MSHGESVAKNVRAITDNAMNASECPPEITPQQEKRRLRWKRNKAAERARKRKLAPAPLESAIIEQIMRERDRRAAAPSTPAAMHFGAHNHGWGTHAFHCDVWAARTVLWAQHGHRKISDGMIARWMAENDLSHGYTHGERSSSLRTMVGRARKAIEILETHITRRRPSPCWAPFSDIAENDGELI